MKTPNPEHVKKLCSVVNTSSFPALLSIKMVDIGIGYAVIEMDIEEKHRQLIGVVHGGVFASLIDTVAFWSVYYGIEDPNVWLISVDLKVNYLSSASSGKLIARGRQIKVGKKLCYADAQVTDEQGNILAHGSSTLMILQGKKMAKNFSLPQKFLTV